ncbi:hypothetical protein [Campylobacter lanienae]|nr:hypothetical protein [Campylobacter lanienae]
MKNRISAFYLNESTIISCYKYIRISLITKVKKVPQIVPHFS